MVTKPFLTPENERSFSGLVDRVVLLSGKTQALLDVIQYANATVRECQTLGLFARDLLEEVWTADAQPYIWTRPTPYFRSIRTVRYQTQMIFPKFRPPGKRKEDETELHYYYAADDYYVFNGPLIGEVVGFANYYWQKPLRYFAKLGVTTTAFPGGPYTVRPAYYDIDLDQWQYLNGGETAYVSTTGDATVDAARRKLAFNWLIQDWWDTIMEGVKAKVFKQYNDDRAAAAYSLYKQMQSALRNTVGTETESFNSIDG